MQFATLKGKCNQGMHLGCQRGVMCIKYLLHWGEIILLDFIFGMLCWENLLRASVVQSFKVSGTRSKSQEVTCLNGRFQ